MLIADLHIHSRYSRATSRDCIPEQLEWWARRKGIQVIGTGDFTHPAWREELKEKLTPAEDGLYRLKEAYRMDADGAFAQETPRFMVSGEISSIYKKNGRVRKVHNVILLPSLEAAEQLALRLERIGNIHSDGRPILGLDSRDLLEITLDVCPEAEFIPAHIWTPHFSLFGAFSGFDTIEECFEDLTGHIHALETGLSSDPPMNWRLSALDRYTLVSHSDAHSPAKLGREADLFDTAMAYPAMMQALRDKEGGKLAGTIEFFPEEGKYHFDGHRNCQQCLTPEEADRYSGKCPVCGKKLTIGVLHRAQQLADRPEGYRPENAASFESLVPLPEVIAASSGTSTASKRTMAQYEQMLYALGSEFDILRRVPLDEIETAAGVCITEGIRRVRQGKVHLTPGFDGEYGRVQILSEEEREELCGQLCFFPGQPAVHGKAQAQKSAAVKKKKEVPAVPLHKAEEPNAEQQKAVQSTAAVTAVIAGPGTGKTKTLVSRIQYMVKEKGVKPADITAVTFTNKAAAEMRERLEKVLGRTAAKAMHIGTFHSLCLHLLENITLIDEEEAQIIAAEVLQECHCKQSPKRFLQAVSRQKNGTTETDLDPNAFALYTQRLQTINACDFDDLLLRVLKRCEAGTVYPQFTHLLVDEFQDIDELQYRLIMAWSRQGKTLFVIGDPDQSIYGFRGADAHCFDRLAGTYAELSTIRLLRNYRSTPEIVQGALGAIAKNHTADAQPTLQAQRESGAPILVMRAEDDFAEAVYLAKEIGRIVGGIDMLEAQAGSHDRHVRSFSDIAVLYRTHRQAELLEKCLRIESIPYVVTGRDDVLSDSLVRGVLGFFRTLVEPQDSASLQICLKMLWNCGKDTLAAIRKEKMTPAALAEGSALEKEESVRCWLVMYTQYKARLTEEPHLLIEDLLHDLEIVITPALDRLAHMAVLHRHLQSFLQELTLGAEGDVQRSGGKQYTPDAVTLMTLHGSKGLEFPVVFLCGVKRGCIPLEAPGRMTDPEEERRLFYVGMTRAKEELILLTQKDESVFLHDIPVSLCQFGQTADYRPLPKAKQLSFFD